jgi:hypothetical protein
MDAVRNPFAPGAGSQPPELAGREEILSAADTALQRVLAGRPAQSQLLLGLRGVGKTVLLNRIEQMAEGRGHVTSFVEAPEDRTLVALLYPKLQHALRKLSLAEGARRAANAALRALRNLAATFKISLGEFAVSVGPEPGVADSGNLEHDVTELFLRVGEAARAAGRGWALLVDEVQYLSAGELAALIVAMHRVNQKGLPLLFFGAGLPTLAALSGDAKSYAERLFAFPRVDALPAEAAARAIRQPIEAEEESIEEEALGMIVERTRGYPFLLQEWGYQCWSLAERSPIGRACVEQAERAALRRLDDGFFKVRIDRLTPKEKAYVIAMARLGSGPYRSSEVAGVLGEKLTALAPRRARIIAKGMVYSPAHGEIDFTVPMFDDYLRRHWLEP